MNDQKQRYTIKSFVRVRPVIDEDIASLPSKTIPPMCVVVDQDETTVVVKSELYEHKQFRCDRAFSQLASQDMVYAKTIGQDIKRGLLERGRDLVVLAYGNTGTGKSFTIFNSGIDSPASSSGMKQQQGSLFGPEASHHARRTAHDKHYGRNQRDGLAFQAMEELFQYQEQHGARLDIKVSFCQLYLEKFYDLLGDDAGTPLSLRDAPPDPHNSSSSRAGGAYVENLRFVDVSSSEQAVRAIEAGLARRVSRRTTHNIKSSRSHAILTIRVQDLSDPASTATPRMIRFFDLAGSEKLLPSEKTRRVSLAESVNINKSVACLSNLIHKLCDVKTRHEFVPFRDSKLTRLLVASLRGAAQVAIISHIAPTTSHYDGTVSTLKFALKASKVVFIPAAEVPPALVPVPVSEATNDISSSSSNNSKEPVGGGVHSYVMGGGDSLPTIPPPAHTHDANADTDVSPVPPTRPAPAPAGKAYSAESVGRMVSALHERSAVMARSMALDDARRAGVQSRFAELNERFAAMCE
jgi:hypothetical protein